MKVKLLKKVRKRFTIEYVTKNNDIRHWIYGMDVPLYLIEDDEDGWRSEVKYTKKEALDVIQKWARRSYFNTHTIVRINKLNKSEKIWYNDKI